MNHVIYRHSNALPSGRWTGWANKGLLALLLTAGVLLSGCGSMGGNYFSPDRQSVNEEGQHQTITEAQDIEQGIIQAFPDIPVPATHRVDLSESVIFTSPSQTVGKIVLKGNADGASLYRFFDEAMSNKGWSSVNQFQSAVSSLYFAKPGKFAAIVITEDKTVYINVGPE